MMSLHLLRDRWIPVVRRSGKRESIAPHEIVSNLEGDPILRVAAWRPDFEAALIQFWIGLLHTCCQPENDEDWHDWLEVPPTPEALRAAFSLVDDDFRLAGPAPRFMQDQDKLEVGARSVRQLLIDAPGEKTISTNKDLFSKRDDGFVLGLPAAAMALLTLQLNAPGGGQGHRTSLRGGGPLTTIWEGDDLWQSVWHNVVPGTTWAVAAPKDSRDRFPWTGPTRTSEKHRPDVFPTEQNRLLHFWSTPRRIVLEIESGRATCGLSGEKVNEYVRTFRTRNFGENYTGPWAHPLTPYYAAKEGDELIPLKGGSNGVTYREWSGIVLRTVSANGRIGLPALVVRSVLERSHDEPTWRTLRVTGYDLDNMKARGFIDERLPVPVGTRVPRGEFERQIRLCIDASVLVGRALRTAVLRALFGTPEVTSTGKTRWSTEADATASFFSSLEKDFVLRTEREFYRLVERTCVTGADDLERLRRDWLAHLGSAASELYEQIVGKGDLRALDPRAVVLARRELRWSTNIKNKLIRKVLDLLEEVPPVLEPVKTEEPS